MTAQPQTIEAQVLDVSINRAALTQAVTKAKRFACHKSTIAILSCIRLFGTENGLTVEASDMDNMFRSVVEGPDCVGIEVHIDANRFEKLLKSAKASDTVQLSYDTSDIEVVSITLGNLRVKLDTQDKDQWDDVAAFWKNHDVLHTEYMDMEDFMPALKSVAHSINTEETRYYLNGIYMHSGEDRFKMVSTDGHRLTCAEMPGKTKWTEGEGYILPLSAIKPMLTMWAKEKGGIYVAIRATSSVYEVGRDTLSVKHIDGTFPDYRRVVPTGNDMGFSIECAALTEAIKQVMIVCDSDQNAVRLTLKKGSLEVYARSENNRTAQLMVPANETNEDSLHGDNGIGVNSAYMVEVMKALDADRVEFHTNYAGSPMRITPTDRDDIYCVLMPMRI